MYMYCRKILLRLNAREFKSETHRQALVKVVTFMTAQHRLPCLVQYDRFLRDGNDFYLIHENYQVHSVLKGYKFRARRMTSHQHSHFA